MSENKSSFAGWVVVSLTAVIAVTAVVQVLAFIQSERAFVAPAGANFAKRLDVGINPLPMYLDLRNGGKSMAVIKELTAAITHKLPSEPPNLKGQEFAFPPIVAGGTSRRALEFETGWGEETTNAVISGSMKFYIFGAIKYEDGFSIFGPKETGFCFVYTPTTDPSIPVFQNCIELPYTYTK